MNGRSQLVEHPHAVQYAQRTVRFQCMTDREGEPLRRRDFLQRVGGVVAGWSAGFPSRGKAEPSACPFDSTGSTALTCAQGRQPFAKPGAAPLIASVEKVTLRRGRDGSGPTWFHPRACMIPGAQGATVFMTLQQIAGSDYGQPKNGIHGDLLLARIRWSQPNRPTPAL